MGTPRVRAVIVNYEGGRLVERCLDRLLATDWPAEALEVVVVDNASTDASPDRIEAGYPGVELVRSRKNLGFAGGNDLALADLDGIDYVALVNPDAFVEAGWLAPLVDAVGRDPAVGAANPRLLLEPRFVEATLETAGFRPGRGDPRTLGVRVSGVRSATSEPASEPGGDALERTLFRDGFFDLEADPATPAFHWSEPEATLWLPLPADAPDPTPGAAKGATARFELRLDAPEEKEVVLRSGTTVATGVVGPEPRWVELRSDAEAFDVVNSAGNDLVDGAYGADRGFGERDGPAFDEPAEVFAWSGAVVLLDARYLRDVGLFDDSFFMYSEDLDLSWRGRLRGWRYRYVPESRARHAHGALAGHRTPLADHCTHRNGLVTLVKNAPAATARRELRRYVADLGRMVRAEVLLPLRRGGRPHPRFARRRARVLLAVIARLPRALWQRVRIGRGALVSRARAVEGFDAPRGP